MPLSEIIIQKIRRSGAIPFRDFMEMALYYPELGYYTSPKEKIGKCGDYFTSPNLTAAFGEMPGRHLEEIWANPLAKIHVVELRAGRVFYSSSLNIKRICVTP